GQPIVLQFWPDDWPPDFRPIGPDPKQALRQTLRGQRTWDASLVIGSANAARALLTDAGELEDPGIKSNPFGGLAGAVSKTSGVSSGPPGATSPVAHIINSAL